MQNRLSSLRGQDKRDDSFYKKHYGLNAVVTRLGKINIVHLDSPSQETIQKRIEEITREEITGEAWDDDCPCCRMIKDEPHDVIYPGEIEGEPE